MTTLWPWGASQFALLQMTRFTPLEPLMENTLYKIVSIIGLSLVIQEMFKKIEP